MKGRWLRRCADLLLCLLLMGCSSAGREPSGAEFRVPEEKRLVVYTSHKAEVYEPIIREFEMRSGIWVELVTGGTNELMGQLQDEEAAQRADVVFGGGVESFERNRDLFQSYQPKGRELLKEKYRGEDRVWTVFTELPVVFIYNRKLCSSTQAPQGWRELLRGRWRGKIAFADPERSASSCTILMTLLLALRDGENGSELLHSFAAVLNGRLTESSGEVLDLVSAGELPLGITLEETARKYIDRGADIAILYPEEGTTAVPDGCAIVKGSRHAANAERFLDFILSEDVQRLAAEKLYRRSVREDIGSREQETAEHFLQYPFDWAVENQEEAVRTFQHYMEEGK